MDPLFISNHLKRQGEEANFINGKQEDTYEFFQRIRDIVELGILHLDKFSQEEDSQSASSQNEPSKVFRPASSK